MGSGALTKYDSMEQIPLLPCDIKVAFEIGSRDVKDSIYMARYSDWEIHAFEPNPNVLEACRKTLSDSKFGDRITLHEVAAMDYDGTVEFHALDGSMAHVGSSSIHMLAPEFGKFGELLPAVNVPCVRIDTLILNGTVPKPHILQIDVQGAEMQVLRGFGEFLSQVKIMFLEVPTKPQYSGTSLQPEIEEFLFDKEFVKVDWIDQHWFADAVYCKKEYEDIMRLYCDKKL